MRWVLSIGVSLSLLSCSTRALLMRELVASEKKFNDHTGFVLYDPETKKTLLEYNAEKYFTPASNTKIFTFYTALQILGDSVPGLKYVARNDSLMLWGTGDPSFLYANTFDNTRIYNFLKNSKEQIFLATSNFQTEPFGPGWAWDDYNDAYSAERSSFPVYGNLIRLKQQDKHISITPLRFAREFTTGDSVYQESKMVRRIDSNQISFFPGKKNKRLDSWEIPFHVSGGLLTNLLSDTLKKQVTEINLPLPHQTLTLYSIPADSLYRVMMQESDNFIAEQLLLMCAGLLSDTLKPEIAIRYAKKNFLFDLPDDPVWVDGSGLSRYNLFTPRSIIRLWEKIYTKLPRERLFKLLAIGGQTGTIKNLYKSDPPFVFGKTGSLSNNHALSGYLVTRKGNVLIFSFMNSNFVAPAREIRNMMQHVLLNIRDKY